MEQKQQQLKCKNCGAPRTRRECLHCGTRYYTGPELPEEAFRLHGFPVGYEVVASSTAYSDYYVTGGRLYDRAAGEFVEYDYTG